MLSSEKFSEVFALSVFTLKPFPGGGGGPNLAFKNASPQGHGSMWPHLRLSVLWQEVEGVLCLSLSSLTCARRLIVENDSNCL